MKNWKKKNIVLISILAMALATVLSACGKKSSNGANVNVSGNIKVSGDGVVSSSNLNGYPLQAGISNIQRSAGGTIYNNNGGQYLTFNITVNGQNLTSQTMPTALNNYSTGQYGSGQTGVSGITVYYHTFCETHLCDTVYMNLYFGSSNSPEWKQIGLRKNMIENKIVRAIELQGVSQNLIDSQAMIQRLKN